MKVSSIGNYNIPKPQSKQNTNFKGSYGSGVHEVVRATGEATASGAGGLLGLAVGALVAFCAYSISKADEMFRDMRPSEKEAFVDYLAESNRMYM